MQFCAYGELNAIHLYPQAAHFHTLKIFYLNADFDLVSGMVFKENRREGSKYVFS